MHKDKVYHQHNGVSLGSQLGMTSANFFLAHIEKKCLKQI